MKFMTVGQVLILFDGLARWIVAWIGLGLLDLWDVQGWQNKMEVLPPASKVSKSLQTSKVSNNRKKPPNPIECENQFRYILSTNGYLDGKVIDAYKR